MNDFTFDYYKLSYGGQLDELSASLAARCRVYLLSSLYYILVTIDD